MPLFIVSRVNANSVIKVTLPGSAPPQVDVMICRLRMKGLQAVQSMEFTAVSIQKIVLTCGQFFPVVKSHVWISFTVSVVSMVPVMMW
jgi:hypothetical protein